MNPLKRLLYIIPRVWSRIKRAFEWHIDADFDDMGDIYSNTPIPGSTPMHKALHLLQGARHILIVVGSGLSADSGIATFRDPETGLYAFDKWRRFTHVQTFESHEHEEMLHWHQVWREHMLKASPNPGHEAIVAMAAKTRVSIITQNVDELIERAAFDAQVEVDIWHAHGRLSIVQCHTCKHTFYDPDFDFDGAPTCARCQGRLRPGVVWFGEDLDPEIMAKANAAVLDADVCLIVGTSGIVHPVASIPKHARSGGASLIEVNTEETELSPICHVCLRGEASTLLPQLIANLGN